MQLVSCVLALCFFSPIITGKKIQIPPPITDTGVKVIPDAGHPFRAPGRDDQRGPCPGLNTLANHGYLPRNGIASVAEITNAVQEGFNMDYSTGLTLVAFGMLARGNVLLDKLSIGGPSKHVPPLPGNIDGTPGGLATHGRFEGDVSMFRDDFALGDNVHFQQDLFDQLLAIVDELGNGTIINAASLAEFKFQRYLDSKARNPTFEFHALRFAGSLGEAAFTLSFFPNSTEGVLTVPVATSIFAHQRFPPNWHRAPAPVGNDILNPLITAVLTPHLAETVMGATNKEGVFVLDPPLQQDQCTNFDIIANEVPAALLGPKATPEVKRNAQDLLEVLSNILGPGCAATPRQVNK